MKCRDLIILFLIALSVLLAASRLVSSPGYMDAEYYFTGGLQLARGNGFQEPFLWNYLDQPQGIPHPSHTYWMPLASLVSAAGMIVGGSLTFQWAQAPFLLLAALIAPLTGQIAFRLTKNRWYAWVAGMLAVGSGYYLNLLVTTETFALYMVMGSAFLLLAFPNDFSMPARRAFLIGLVAGLMHLTRADGLVWLFATGGVVAWWSMRYRIHPGQIAILVSAVLGGYVLVMAPWYIRNVVLFDSLFPPGGSRTLWLTEYNHTFIYPADLLNPTAWWNAGLKALLDARRWALGFNLKNLLGAQTLVVLLPMVILGAVRLRKQPIVAAATVMWVLTLAVMTVVFPFAGARGGYIHSSAALQPVIWAVSPLGLAVLVEWGERHRGWNKARSVRVFSVALIVIVFLCTLALFWIRVVGTDPGNPTWGADTRRYAAVDRALQSLDVVDDAVIMVNNPPGFYVATGRPSIVIPGGDLDSVVAAGRDYKARALILESVQENLTDLYEYPAAHSEMIYQTTVDGVHIFTFSFDTAEGANP